MTDEERNRLLIRIDERTARTVKRINRMIHKLRFPKMSKLSKWMIKCNWTLPLITFAAVYVLVFLMMSEAIEMKTTMEELKALTDSLVNSF